MGCFASRLQLPPSDPGSLIIICNTRASIFFSVSVQHSLGLDFLIVYVKHLWWLCRFWPRFDCNKRWRFDRVRRKLLRGRGTPKTNWSAVGIEDKGEIGKLRWRLRNSSPAKYWDRSKQGSLHPGNWFQARWNSRRNLKKKTLGWNFLRFSDKAIWQSGSIVATVAKGHFLDWKDYENWITICEFI